MDGVYSQNSNCIKTTSPTFHDFVKISRNTVGLGDLQNSILGSMPLLTVFSFLLSCVDLLDHTVQKRKPLDKT